MTGVPDCVAWEATEVTLPKHGFRLTWAHWVAIFGAWTLLSVFFAPELYLFFVYRKERIEWTTALLLTMANTTIAAVLVPPVIGLALRFPLGQGRWRRSLAVHLPACFAFSVIHSGLYALFCFASPAFHTLFTRFHPNLLTYWAVVGFVEAARHFRAVQQRDQQLAQLQLELMRAQLQPHFLFNTLNTISAMMHVDVRAADQMVNRLSELLRMTLEAIGRHQVPLRQELDFVRKYMEIEQIRFGPGIQFEIDVQESVLDALVPSMVLQPLVENSIRHGFRAHGRRGTVWIRGRKEVGQLDLSVTDDGAGFTTPERPGGMGLANIRGRLEQLYPEAYEFSIAQRGNDTPEEPARDGARVTLRIPLRINNTLEASSEEWAHAGSDRR